MLDTDQQHYYITRRHKMEAYRAVMYVVGLDCVHDQGCGVVWFGFSSIQIRSQISCGIKPRTPTSATTIWRIVKSDKKLLKTRPVTERKEYNLDHSGGGVALDMQPVHATIRPKVLFRNLLPSAICPSLANDCLAPLSSRALTMVICQNRNSIDLIPQIYRHLLHHSMYPRQLFFVSKATHGRKYNKTQYICRS
jgi:hypothetical protein